MQKKSNDGKNLWTCEMVGGVDVLMSKGGALGWRFLIGATSRSGGAPRSINVIVQATPSTLASAGWGHIQKSAGPESNEMLSALYRVIRDWFQRNGLPQDKTVETVEALGDPPPRTPSDSAFPKFNAPDRQ